MSGNENAMQYIILQTHALISQEARFMTYIMHTATSPGRDVYLKRYNLETLFILGNVFIKQMVAGISYHQ